MSTHGCHCGWPARGKDSLRKGQPAYIRGCTDVRPRVVCGSPVGDVYLSSGLYCSYSIVAKCPGMTGDSPGILAHVPKVSADVFICSPKKNV